MQKGVFSASVLSEFEEKHAGGGSVQVVLGTLWVMPCIPCLRRKPSCGAPCGGQVRETKQSFVLKQP